MKLAIDMQGCQSAFSGNRGVGRYVRELVKQLIRCSKNEIEIFLVLNGRLNCDETIKYFENEIDRDHIKVWYNYFEFGQANMSKELNKIRIAELFREWYIHQLNVDAIWVPNFQEGWSEANVAISSKLTNGSEIIISTLHDVTPLLFPDIFLRDTIRTWYDEKINYVKESDIVVSVSNFTKEKVTEFLNIESSKIHTIYNGYDSEYFYPDKNFIDAEKKDKFFLYAGGAGHHKNIDSLIEAYSLIDSAKRDEYHLKFVGGDWVKKKEEMLNKATGFGINENQLEFLGFLSNDDLRDLMQRCTGFIFPSYAEGFGLPPLEAMACGAPTIVSNATSLKEIACSEEALFEPFDIKEIANKMNRLIEDFNYSNKLIEDGLLKAKEFSWEKSAIELKRILLQQDIKPKEETYTTKDLCNDIINLINPDDYKTKSLIAKSIESNTIYQTKNIYIDVSAVVLNEYVTGIQRVVNGLIESLKNIFVNNSDIKVTCIYSNPSTNYFYTAEYNGRKYVKRENQSNDYSVNFHDGDILLMPDLHPQNTIQKTNLLKNLCVCGTKVISILYDLIPIEHPEYYENRFVEEYNRFLYAISSFSGVISISKTTHNYYLDWCKNNNIDFPPYFINDYFYLGSDFKNANPSKGIPEEGYKIIEFLKTHQIALMVGTIEPRKMHSKVLAAFEKLWENGKDYCLVFVGRNGWKMDEFAEYIINHKENGKKLFWLSQISDEYLEKIYELSSGVIIASIQEGFGLPIIEASKHKKPLLIRNIPVFKEIAGNGSEYFDKDDPSSLSKEIEDWLAKIQNNDCISSSTIKHITWEESAKMLIKKINKNLID